jgi:hypothetical protein
MTSHFRAVSDEELAQLLLEPERIHSLVRRAAPSEEHLELERTWQALHFLMCGEPWGGPPPLDFIMSGGEPIGNEDIAHGPARGFTADEVRVIALALGAVTWVALGERWDPDVVRAADLYAIDLARPEAELEQLKAAFESLRGFITSLATQSRGMLVYML